LRSKRNLIYAAVKWRCNETVKEMGCWLVGAGVWAGVDLEHPGLGHLILITSA
jgi:hypothetical protein